jgi:hypothetical protein
MDLKLTHKIGPSGRVRAYIKGGHREAPHHHRRHRVLRCGWRFPRATARRGARLLLLQSDRILHMDTPVKRSAPFYIIIAIAVTAGGIIGLKIVWELWRYVFGV